MENRILLQTLWNPDLAKKCILSPEIPREHALDCVINSLVVLDFLQLEDARELSRRINDNNVSSVNSGVLSEFFSNKLNSKVEYGTLNVSSFSTRENYIDWIITYLLENLKIKHATLLTYYYTKLDGTITGHAVIIRRTIFNTILVNDIQQGTQKNIRELLNDINIVYIILFFKSRDEYRMNIDVELNKLVPENKMELGGKRIKRKNKTSKTSKTTKTNKTNKTNKSKKSKSKTSKSKTSKSKTSKSKTSKKSKKSNK
jgi:hypothetical protein